MDISTSTNILYERYNNPYIKMKDSIIACHRAGFKNIDFGFAELAFSSKIFSSNEWETEIREYKVLGDGLGIKYTQGHGCILNFCDKNNDYEFKLELLKRSIRGAQILGIPWLVVHPSSLVEDYKISNKTHSINVLFFRELSDYAKKYDVGLAIENMWGYSKNGVKNYAISADELLNLIIDIDRENVQACWDVEHASIEGLEQGSSIMTLGEHIKATHISDETGLNNIHVLPFTGNVKWEEIISAFATIKYKGNFSLEIQHYLPKMPLELCDEAMRLAYRTGEYLVKMFNQNSVLDT